MNTEVRFLIAIFLMFGVVIVTNVMFPPLRPTPSATAAQDSAAQATPGQPLTGFRPDALRVGDALAARPDSLEVVGDATERLVEVSGPLYRHTFSSHGARLVSAELLTHNSFTREGPAQLIPEGTEGAFGLRLVVGPDTLDLHDASFTPSREQVVVDSLSGNQELTFRHERRGLVVEMRYTFRPDDYLIDVVGRVEGLDRALLLVDLGSGLQLNDLDQTAEERALAYVGNHLQEGITSYPLIKAVTPVVHEGPFLWAAFKSKFFVLAMLPGADGAGPEQFGGVIVQPEGPNLARVAVTEPIAGDGRFGYRAFVGPQDYARLTALGNELDEVNPYGWRMMRSVIRPLVGAITSILVLLHNTFDISYGWVLVLFGVLMRVILWPLNQKAMRAQMTNMAVQPKLKEIQTKYKDKPEKLQQEMMRLYKEEGFNPMAGCLPMLLPFPILIALFFVFQNTIEFRGVPFFWLPDLSAPDPLFILPVFLGISMFLLQWISMRSMPDPNPQMKMMMWMMPIMMVFLFFRLAAGINVYYSISNLASIPQQLWVAKERKKQPLAPVKPPAK